MEKRLIAVDNTSGKQPGSNDESGWIDSSECVSRFHRLRPYRSKCMGLTGIRSLWSLWSAHCSS